MERLRSSVKKQIIKLFSRTDVGSYDISELYEFADETGILERHRQMLSQPFQESQVGFMVKLTFYGLPSFSG